MKTLGMMLTLTAALFVFSGCGNGDEAEPETTPPATTPPANGETPPTTPPPANGE
ncbi:MAG: hypothetical protein JJU36_15795 [Phycisphaeraceae bacterium]|nr:hypothetical protein [Phycisphaeraceae bacterium]